LDGLSERIPSGGSVVAICSFAGLRYAERQEAIDDFLRAATFAGARAWCEAHPDVVGDGYQFSKEAMAVFVLHRSMDLVERGVRFNCTSPGRTDTPLIHEVEQTIGVELYRSLRLPMDRYGTPEEQAWALAFLNSDAASYVTGANLFVDGGMLAGTLTGRMAVPTALTLPSHDS
jgi:NAD(P)-dependent dehydrogenase (short-subunit alcohol dehydrogenase family)